MLGRFNILTTSNFFYAALAAGKKNPAVSAGWLEIIPGWMPISRNCSIQRHTLDTGLRGDDEAERFAPDSVAPSAGIS